MVHATGHHPFEGIMSFRDKSKLGTAQSVKNRTSPTKSTIKTVRLKTIFLFFVAKLEGTYWKKSRWSFRFPSLRKSSPTIRRFWIWIPPQTWFRDVPLSKTPANSKKKPYTPGVFNQQMSPNKKEKYSKSSSQPLFFMKTVVSFSGENIELRVRGDAWFFFFVGKKTPEKTGLLPLEGLRDDSGLVLLPLQGGLAGDTWVPNEMVEDIQVKNDGKLYIYIHTYISCMYIYVYICIWYVCSCLNGFQFVDVKDVSEA